MIQDQEATVYFAESVRKHLCSYGGSDRCDCKFGADNIGKMTEAGCGCPEMRVLTEFLKIITPAEWSRIVKRLAKTPSCRLWVLIGLFGEPSEEELDA